MYLRVPAMACHMCVSLLPTYAPTFTCLHASSCSPTCTLVLHTLPILYIPVLYMPARIFLLTYLHYLHLGPTYLYSTYLYSTYLC